MVTVSSHRLSQATAIAIALTIATAASAETDLKAQGDELFDAGRYAEAHEAYKRAYTKRPDASLLYNDARALEALGEYPEALDELERFSTEAPPEVRAKVPKLSALINDLRSRIATVRVTTNVTKGRLYLRGKDMGPIEPSGAHVVRTRAGEATIRVVADGYRPFSRSLTLAGGRVRDVDAQLTENPRPSEPRPESESVTSKWWFWSAVGAVLIGGATATTFALTQERDAAKGEGFTPGQIRVRAF